MLTNTHAQRPASLVVKTVIVDERPRRVSEPAACAALLGHDSALSFAAVTSSGSGMADKRGPVTGVIAAKRSAAADVTGVPPRGCPG